MTEQQINEFKGLTSKEAKELQEKYGKNKLVNEKKESFFRKILHVIMEPMFLLLIIAACIYFILGEPRDGIIMLVFVSGIIGIESIQEWKTDKTLKALKDLSAPHITVLRDGVEKLINSEDLVPGDIMYISEGVKIPADGIILNESTLCIDESSLTGEAEGVWKVSKDSNDISTGYWKKDYCYAGTLVIQGAGVVLVEKIGIQTEYGKIGASVVSAPDNPTNLEKQTKDLVKLCVVIAAILFIIVGCVTYINLPDHKFNDRIIESILSGVTLAMAMIPEEFPVILTVFLSMGAWRLAKKNSLVRKLPAVETLGAISVLCVDKTGTITMNQMTVIDTWTTEENIEDFNKSMRMGCKIDAYDPMEKAIISFCENKGINKECIVNAELVKEYPFTNESKMMGNVWRDSYNTTIIAKGSSENILKICDLTISEREIAKNKIVEMSSKGLRVIALAKKTLESLDEVPELLEECKLKLIGIIGLTDPPRESVKEDIKICTKAGIRVVMITGDNGITASSIAKQINMPNSDRVITGDEIDKMTDEELGCKVKYISIFSRVTPDHKMRIVKAFKSNGEIVAMTGDGVNDAAALKYADIGVAMGKRGSEVSREAADLVLLDDNFSTIVDSIKDGRRIYDNIRKAVGYVLVIHIPIALASLVAPLLGINSANLLLLPLHVVLLEMVIDPTCSIVLENQLAEQDIMERSPRNTNEKLLEGKTILKSVIQGLVIFIASFATYFIFLNNYEKDAMTARTMGLSIILLANMFLVQVNSSNTDYAINSFIKLIKDKVMWAITLGTIFMLGVIIYTPLNSFLKLKALSIFELLLVISIAAVSVGWYEVVKLVNKLKKKSFKA